MTHDIFSLPKRIKQNNNCNLAVFIIVSDKLEIGEALVDVLDVGVVIIEV